MSVFATNEITTAGLALIAQATSANPLCYVMAYSSTTVPSNPEDVSSYDGITGTIDASSATENTTRIVARFGNSSNSQPVKGIAISAKLQSQADSAAVIFAYCSDANSEIVFPSTSLPEQVTRFAFNLTFDPTTTVSVAEAGYATLADLERLVSCHRAGDPQVGDAQTVLGVKTFKDMIIAPDTGDSLRIGSNIPHQDAATGTTLYEPTTNTTECNGTLSIVGELRVEDHILSGTIAHPGFLSSKLIRGVRDLYAMDVQGGYGSIIMHGTISPADSGSMLGSQNATWTHIFSSETHADYITAATNNGFIYVADALLPGSSGVNIGGTRANPTERFNTLYVSTANANVVTIPYVSSAVNASVSLTCDEHGLLVLDGSIVPEDANSYDLGKPQKAWDSLYLDGAVYLSLDEDGGQGFSINASPMEGIAQFNNTYRDASSQAAIGKFDFLDADGDYGTLEAGEYIGMNSTISDVSHVYQPHATTVATIAVGALIMAIIPQGIMDHFAGSVVTAGTEFQVTSATNEVSDARLRYRWYVAMLRADTATGEALWSVSTQADGATVLSSGMYKILCSVDIADSGQIVPVMAVLLQKTSDEYPS